MKNPLAAAVVTAAFSLSASIALAQQGGTADEAKAMLTKAVAAVKADEAKAIDEFNNGTGGFRDRDLYVFCFQATDGKIVALGNPNAKQAIGRDERDFKDSTGKAYGEELFAAAQKPEEGEITEITYIITRPGDPKPVPKTSLVTRVDDLGCGVGYYPQ
jgi:hypothetical protein